MGEKLMRLPAQVEAELAARAAATRDHALITGTLAVTFSYLPA
jgi:hypothetical protein